MASHAVDLVVLVFESISVIAAVSTVAPAKTWNKNEFLAWLIFLLLWTILNALDIIIPAILDIQIINASLFGFILLALISFIPHMRPAAVFCKPSG
ncbi:MAG: hypothetical protein A4E34_02228 [Methanoregula sp. PtaU1.Bin006]|uniref:hypothetical protein n=1 Tax=Methanoregula sp. PtaU1.Bin006 TaxID=1811681 RepID=UPI0009D2B38B|nr:hypothetical protein [Methanoregula sp. PtaU1.Bin006]OPY32851.1 MAG: hypothetical protein A4E34_02228 [Methanoregula sp. PtaU1.Bin006]